MTDEEINKRFNKIEDDISLLKFRSRRSDWFYELVPYLYWYSYGWIIHSRFWFLKVSVPWANSDGWCRWRKIFRG